MPEQQETEPKKRATKRAAATKASAAGSARRSTRAETTLSAAGDADAGPAPAKKSVARKPAAARRPVDDKPAEPVVSTEVAAARSAASPAPTGTVDGATAEGVTRDNPLHKKLGLRPDSVAVLVAPPEEDNPLLPLPKGLTVLADLQQISGLTGGPYEYVHVFARSRADLAEAFASLRDLLAPGGSLWVSWMKQSSDRRRGTFTDLNETIIRRIALTHGMVDVKVVALDRDWSALRLVHRKH